MTRDAPQILQSPRRGEAAGRRGGKCLGVGIDVSDNSTYQKHRRPDKPFAVQSVVTPVKLPFVLSDSPICDLRVVSLSVPR